MQYPNTKDWSSHISRSLSAAKHQSILATIQITARRKSMILKLISLFFSKYLPKKPHWKVRVKPWHRDMKWSDRPPLWCTFLLALSIILLYKTTWNTTALRTDRDALKDCFRPAATALNEATHWVWSMVICSTTLPIRTVAFVLCMHFAVHSNESTPMWLIFQIGNPREYLLKYFRICKQSMRYGLPDSTVGEGDCRMHASWYWSLDIFYY